MRAIVLLLALASALTFAADNVAVAPRPTTSHKPQATSYGAESITIPQMLSYQGKLTDTLGQPVPNGNYQLTFRLYTQPTGGSAFWSEPQTILVKSGLFSALLGAVTPITSLPDAGALYLSLQVAADPELSPRLRIASAAYAYLSERAANADLLQGKDTSALDSRYVNEGQASSVTSNMIVDGTIAAVDLDQMGASSGQVMKWNGSAWVPRNDSVGQSSGGTVTSVSQATGVVCSPNPITSTGTVGFDQTYGDGRYERVANKNVASGYCGLDASTKVPNGRLYTGTGNGLDADLLDGNHAAAFAPASGSGNYIQNQSSAYQSGSWKIVGQGTDSLTSGSGIAALYGTATAGNFGVWGNGTTWPGVEARAKTAWGALEAINYDSTQTGYTAGAAGHGRGGSSGAYGVLGEGPNVGVYGVSTGAEGVCGTTSASGKAGVYGSSSSGYGVEGVSSSSCGAYDSSGSSYGVYGVSTSGYGVRGKSTSNYGVCGTSTSNYGAVFSSDSSNGVYAASNVGGTGYGLGVYCYSPTYWGGHGYRASSQRGSSYGYGGTRGGLQGYSYWGNPWTFGVAGYTYGDSVRSGGVIGAAAVALDAAADAAVTRFAGAV